MAFDSRALAQVTTGGALLRLGTLQPKWALNLRAALSQPVYSRKTSATAEVHAVVAVICTARRVGAAQARAKL